MKPAKNRLGLRPAFSWKAIALRENLPCPGREEAILRQLGLAHTSQPEQQHCGAMDTFHFLH